MKIKRIFLCLVFFISLSFLWSQSDNGGEEKSEEELSEEYIETDFQGKEDIDMDGVIDSEDQCPYVEGPVENKGCPLIKKEEIKIVEEAVSNLEFESGKDVIRGNSFRSLDELSVLLKQHAGDWKLKIVGHTDNEGTPEGNMKLSEKRAKAVMNYFISKGVKHDTFFVDWSGQTKPVASNKTEEGRKRNRRVNMSIIKSL